MGMFNNIYTNVGIYKQVFTIPEASVQAMDLGNPYSLIITNNEFYAIPIACYIYIINNTTAYTLFNHLHLQNGTTGDTTAIISENATQGGLGRQTDTIYSFVMNVQQAALFCGLNFNRNLGIGFDTIPTTGNGDMVVTLFYTKNNIF